MPDYKLSYYSIPSEPLNEKNQRVLFSTRTSKLVLVSGTCYQALEENLIDLIPESIREKLIQAGLLVPAHETEIETIVTENRSFTEANTIELYEIIQPSAMCQLGCYYCGQKHTKDYVSEEVADKLIERIYNKFCAGGYKKISLGWFGGEPLMGLPQMRYIHHGLKKITEGKVPITGKIVTNGMSLKEGIAEELVTDLSIRQIEITIDGLGDFHDKHRYTKSGEASFDIIYKNVKSVLENRLFIESKCKMIIRCNVDEKNVEGVEPLIRKFAEDNLHTKISRLYFIGIYSWGGNNAHKQSLSKEAFAMKRLQWEILKIQLGYSQHQGLYERKKQTCVATGGNSEMYDAFGNVFNCTEVSYADIYEGTPYKLGNLKEDSLASFKNKPLNDWYDVVKDTTTYPCHSCKLLPVCGGSCPKSWLEGNPACPPFKFSVVKEIELQYLLRSTETQLLGPELDRFTNSLRSQQFYRYE